MTATTIAVAAGTAMAGIVHQGFAPAAAELLSLCSDLGREAGTDERIKQGPARAPALGTIYSRSGVGTNEDMLDG